VSPNVGGHRFVEVRGGATPKDRVPQNESPSANGASLESLRNAKKGRPPSEGVPFQHGRAVRGPAKCRSRQHLCRARTPTRNFSGATAGTAQRAEIQGLAQVAGGLLVGVFADSARVETKGSDSSNAPFRDRRHASNRETRSETPRLMTRLVNRHRTERNACEKARNPVCQRLHSTAARLSVCPASQTRASRSLIGQKVDHNPAKPFAFETHGVPSSEFQRGLMSVRHNRIGQMLSDSISGSGQDLGVFTGRPRSL